MSLTTHSWLTPHFLLLLDLILNSVTNLKNQSTRPFCRDVCLSFSMWNSLTLSLSLKETDDTYLGHYTIDRFKHVTRHENIHIKDKTLDLYQLFASTTFYQHHHNDRSDQMIGKIDRSIDQLHMYWALRNNHFDHRLDFSIKLHMKKGQILALVM